MIYNSTTTNTWDFIKYIPFYRAVKGFGQECMTQNNLQKMKNK